MKITLIAAGIALVLVQSNVQADGKKDINLSIKVVDESCCPVENAEVGIGFRQNRDELGGKNIAGLTDSNGMFFAKSWTYDEVGILAKKDEFYPVRARFTFTWDSKKQLKPFDPAQHPVSLILKHIKSPIPMYVKRVEAEIPVLDKPIGFDLMKGDWVSPYGSGIRDDFLITFSRERRGENDFDLYITVGFYNKGDGIQEVHIENPMSSELRMPHEAPTNGYQEKWASHAGQRPDTGYFGPLGSVESINYFYRVRTVIDGDGKIKEAYYGKMHGNFYVRSSLRENPKIIFDYYLNPTSNDRNVEFDPEKNLFGGRDHFAP